MTPKAVSRGAVALIAIALGVLTAAGCQYPQDVEGTLDRVEGGTLRVGVIDDPPWAVVGNGDPTGVEPELVKRFAEDHDATVEWYPGTEEELVEAMRGFQLDLIVGGLTRSSPAGLHTALTRPYIDTEIEYGIAPGDPPLDDFDGREVYVVEGSEAAALMRQEEDDAVPVFVEEEADLRSPALTDNYWFEPLGLVSSNNIKRDDEHAMAVPMGENAFLVELEHFLLDRGGEANALLAEEVSREIPPSR
jgi:polar amino acid transport system substrate-binding protein